MLTVVEFGWMFVVLSSMAEADARMRYMSGAPVQPEPEPGGERIVDLHIELAVRLLVVAELAQGKHRAGVERDRG